MPVKLDLGEFPSKKSIGRIKTTIGELEVFSINIGGQIALNKELGEPLRKCDPLGFIRHFIRYTCFPADTVKDGNVPSTNKRLSFEDILKLTDNELETIAELYIKGNEYLFKKQKINKKIIDGKEVIAVEPGELKCKKNDSENYKEYLLRLIINEEDEIKASFEKAFDGINSFSKGLSDQIKKTLDFGEKLKGAANFTNLEPKNIFPPLTIAKPEMYLSPQEHFLSKIFLVLNKLFGVSDKSKQFLIESNENQMKIAGEIKKSSDNATELSKKNILLTVFVIIISAVSIVFSAYIYWRSTIDSKVQREIYQKNVKLIVNELSKFNRNTIATNDARIKELECEIKKLKELIGQHKTDITKLNKKSGE